MAIISCGVFDRKYIYFILSYALIMILFATTLLIINGNLEDVKIYKNVLLSLLLSNFGLIFCYIPELITKKLVSDKKEKNINRNNAFKFQLFKNEKKKLAIEYIFNDFSTKIAVKDMIFIFICSLLLIVIDYLKIFIQKQNVEEDQLILNEQYNYIQLLFIVIFAYFFYKMRFYKHQIYSILIIIILGIIRYIIKIFHYYEWKKPNICFDLFLQIIIAIFESIVIIFAKALMEIKYFSPYKVCYTFGIINSIIILILLIIFSFIKKNTTNWFFSLDYEEISLLKEFDKNAVYHYKDFGPCFGYKPDIGIMGNPLIEKKLRLSHWKHDSKENKNIQLIDNQGTNYIKALDYEVFQVIFD